MPRPEIPKPTIAEQKIVQMYHGDKAKVQAYCDIGKLQDQMEHQKKDNKTIEALCAKIYCLAQSATSDGWA